MNFDFSKMIIIPLSKKLMGESVLKTVQEKIGIAEQICTYNFNILKVENINTQCIKLIHLFKQMIAFKHIKKQIRSVLFDYAIILLKNNIITFDVIENKYRNYIINYYNNNKSNNIATSTTIIYYYNIKYLYKLLVQYTIVIKKMKNVIITLQNSVNRQILMYHKTKIIQDAIITLNCMQIRICVLLSDISTKLYELS